MCEVPADASFVALSPPRGVRCWIRLAAGRRSRCWLPGWSCRSAHRGGHARGGRTGRGSVVSRRPCRFISRHAWEADRIRPALARVLVERLLGPTAAIVVVVDDTLFRRWEPKVSHAIWTHKLRARPQHAQPGTRWVITVLSCSCRIVRIRCACRSCCGSGAVRAPPPRRSWPPIWFRFWPNLFRTGTSRAWHELRASQTGLITSYVLTQRKSTGKQSGQCVERHSPVVCSGL